MQQNFFLDIFKLLGYGIGLGGLVKGLVNLFIPCDRNTDLQWV